jgi:hypothetical protein
VPQGLASMGVRSGFKMWCENMCRTRPRALTFLGREQVVELQHGERFPCRPFRKVPDGGAEHRERQELGVVEQLVPIPVPVVQDLPGVVPVADGHPRERRIEGTETLSCRLESCQILRRDPQVLLDSVASQDELGVQAMGRRPTRPLACLRDGEVVSAAAADRRRPLGRAFLRIEAGAAAARCPWSRTGRSGPRRTRDR